MAETERAHRCVARYTVHYVLYTEQWEAVNSATVVPMVRSIPVGKLERILIGQIRATVEAQDLAMSHLADRAGISRSSMWEVMSGRASPTLAWIQRVAEVLEVDPAKLLVGEPVRLPKAAAKAGKTAAKGKSK